LVNLLEILLVDGGLISTVDGFGPGLRGGIVATVVGVIATISGARSILDWWRVSTTESATIREALDTAQSVQIQGHARPLQSSDTLVSPIRNDPCVAYEYSISKTLQDAGDSTIDSGIEWQPFVVSDGTAEIRVDPSEESLDIDTSTNTVGGRQEMQDHVNTERVDVDPSTDTEDSGAFGNPIELVEGTLTTGEEVTIVGKASKAAESVATETDVSAAMTPDGEHLLVTNDGPENTALRTGARGAFLVTVGLIFDYLGVTILSGITGGLVF
jgi:E3 Ubiquitin ligase.